MKTSRTVALAVVIAAAAASCASSSSDDSVTTEVPIASDNPEVSASAALDTTVTAPPDTDPPEEAVTTEAQPTQETTDPPDSEIAELPDDYVDYSSATYAEDANWVCHPNKVDNVCARDLHATIVYADGTTEIEEFTMTSDSPVDCFYVYPTVSSDPAPTAI